MYQVAQFYLLNTIFFLKHLSLYIFMYCYMCTNFNDWKTWLHLILQRMEFRLYTENPVTDVPILP